jgi:hypothetical protein
MSAATIVASEFDGRRVVHVDAMRLQHSGVIVGQSQDGAWLFVQSDRPGVSEKVWHFKVKRAILPAILVID